MAIDKKYIELLRAVEYQLSCNFYPPYPREMVQPCIEAIQAVNQGNPQDLITLPSGTPAKAGELVEFFRLEDLIKTEANK